MSDVMSGPAAAPEVTVDPEAVVSAAARLDAVIDQMSAGRSAHEVLTELVRIRGLLGVLPEPRPGAVDGDDLLAAGARSLGTAVAILQSGAGTSDQIVHLRVIERTLRQWIGRAPRSPIDATRRQRAVALAAALRSGR